MYVVCRAESIVGIYELLEEAEKEFDQLPSDGNTYLDEYDDDIDFSGWDNGEAYFPNATLDSK